MMRVNHISFLDFYLLYILMCVCVCVCVCVSLVPDCYCMHLFSLDLNGLTLYELHSSPIV